MKKHYAFLITLFFVFFTHKTFTQPYYDFTHTSSPGTYSVGGVNVGFNYNLNGGQVYIDHSCPSVLGYNFTNGGYFTFGFNVPIAGVRIRGIRQTFSTNTNIAIKINGTSYALNSSNISSFSACGYNTQGSLSNGTFVGGNGMITITQPGITSLEVQNSGGDYWIFVVEILPLVTATNTPCTGSTLNLASNFGGLTSGVTYNWTGPNGFTSSLNNPSISNASAANSGLYTVTASNGTVTASQTQNVYVNPIPTVNDINNQTLCNGASVNSVNFSSTAFTGTICGEVNEGGTLNLSAPPGSVFTTVPFASYGNASGNCGNFVLGSCNSSNSVSVVSAAAVGKNSFSLVATNDNFGDPCTGTPKNLKVQLNYTTPVTYTWTNSNTSIGLASSGTGNIPSFVATNSSNLPVIATIKVTPKYTNGGTCSGTSKTFTITVNPTPKITAQPVSKTICNGDSTTFTAAASNASGYQWQVNPGSGFIDVSDIEPYSGATTTTLSINGATTLLNNYKYRLVASGSCNPKAISNIATLTIQNTVDSPTGDPIQSFNTGDNLSVLVVNGQNIKWYATAENAAGHVDELPLTTSIVNNKTYYVTQTLGTCESPISLAIKAYNPLLSINDTEKSDVLLTLYPNPVKDVLHFNVETEINKIVIFDMHGKKLLEKTLNGDYKINVQSLVQGVYMVQFFQNEKEMKTLKFIKN
ncbi:T9SS type A sorting domain-containing protein [Flavobacterium gyeonganense]|uniref:T9SS type A sorting domain-containing protein n=1 Tax=Flavobacterium gyeonganense TaxID=1310418 RepID=A0ABV5HE56_9FLAO|nr:T9SS type A sorting domain-containing protein [Flavobacterium gyeonganense]